MLVEGMPVRLNTNLAKKYLDYLNSARLDMVATRLKAVIEENKVYTVNTVNSWIFRTGCVELNGSPSISINNLDGTWPNKLWATAKLFSKENK